MVFFLSTMVPPTRSAVSAAETMEPNLRNVVFFP
jgi:hypothetical protein